MKPNAAEFGDLTAHEWRGVTQLANALFEYEPLAKRGNLGVKVAERLVQMGLAEKGSTSRAYQSRGMPEGYKLSELGWTIHARGRYQRRTAGR